MKDVIRSLVPFLGEKDHINRGGCNYYPFNLESNIWKKQASLRSFYLAIPVAGAIATYITKDPMVYPIIAAGSLAYLFETLPLLETI